MKSYISNTWKVLHPRSKHLKVGILKTWLSPRFSSHSSMFDLVMKHFYSLVWYITLETCMTRIPNPPPPLQMKILPTHFIYILGFVCIYTKMQKKLKSSKPQPGLGNVQQRRCQEISYFISNQTLKMWLFCKKFLRARNHKFSIAGNFYFWILLPQRKTLYHGQSWPQYIL